MCELKLNEKVCFMFFFHRHWEYFSQWSPCRELNNLRSISLWIVFAEIVVFGMLKIGCISQYSVLEIKIDAENGIFKNMCRTKFVQQTARSSQFNVTTFVEFDKRNQICFRSTSGNFRRAFYQSIFHWIEDKIHFKSRICDIWY